MSGKCVDYRKKMTKEELIALIKDSPNFTVYADGRWEYPDHTSNNGNNVIMQMNFDIEQKAGIVVYLPVTTEQQQKIIERT